MEKIRTHYDNLKVARDAPVEVIRAAYRTLTQKYHPDKNPGDSKAARIMALINQSYEVLSDPERRKQHDEWIRSEERGEQRTTSANTERPSATRSRGIRLPVAGSSRYEDLPEATKETLKARVRDERKDQHRISLAGIGGNYGWGVVALLWFVYLIYAATQSRWQGETQTGYMWASAVAGVMVALNSRAVLAWYRKPLRPSLIATPIYVIKTDQDLVWYWPITEITNFKATDYLKNGSYEYTSISVMLGGKPTTFRVTTQGAYEEFVGAIRIFLQVLHQAADRSDQSYVADNDEFQGATVGDAAIARRTVPGTLALLAAATALSVGLAALLGWFNSGLPAPVEPVYASVAPVEPATPVYTPAAPVAPNADAGAHTPDYGAAPASPPPVDYIKEKLGGEDPPSVSGYVPGEKRLNTDGLSTVTIDNSQNDSDVLVKLVYTEGTSSYPVREFFISANGKFTVENVRAGHYDVRYMERWSGAIAKSEPFDLEQTEKEDGTEYSTITMTLYKVRNGNMQTYPIDAKDF